MSYLDLKPILGMKSQAFTNVSLDDFKRNLTVTVTGNINYIVINGTEPERIILSISGIQAQKYDGEWIYDNILLRDIKNEIIFNTQTFTKDA